MKLLKDTDTMVFGCIDGWKNFDIFGASFGQISYALSPKEIRNISTGYGANGADGIFVYQADQYVFDSLVKGADFNL